MVNKHIMIWYRNDLRLQDHRPIYQACRNKDQILPVYCFDTRQWETTAWGFAKTGPWRSRFLLETVQDLRDSLQNLGSNLIVRVGLPELIIPQLAENLGVDAVYWHQEVTSEELGVEKAMKHALSARKIEYQAFWGSTLYHPANLPFEIADLPEVFTSFRKLVEKKGKVSKPLGKPTTLPPLPKVDVGEIPSLEELGVTPQTPDSRGVLAFTGGETAGFARLETYFFTKDCLGRYKETRNGMLGPDYSSKFSPWLANGSLSPRIIYQQVKVYEAERVKNDSTYWLIFELLWRDYFRFIAAKHGKRLFFSSGLQRLSLPWQEDWERFSLWQTGKTGYPLVDANMRELAATGFMSNRGRQNVASFLTKNLGINWTMGAEWFESLLIDYDVCSNWGNWNYTAGVGNDARGFRYFNIPKQSRDYDRQGNYLRHWLPELRSLLGEKIHQPWQLSLAEQKQFGVILGVDYPRPVVDFSKSLQHNEKQYQAALA